MTKCVGIDVHKQACHARVMDEHGKILKQEEFLNERDEFGRFFDGIDDAKVALEASYCWQPVYDFFEDRGYDVKLAHPLKTRMIADTKIKTDISDSEALALLPKLDLLPTSHVPPRETKELRELVRLRTYLVRDRIRFKNKILGELTKRGDKVCRRSLKRRTRPSLKEMGIKTTPIAWQL